MCIDFRRNKKIILSRIAGTVKKSADLSKVVEEKRENWNAVIPLRESLLHHWTDLTKCDTRSCDTMQGKELQVGRNHFVGSVHSDGSVRAT
jgi:hypothetical protein